MEYNEKEAVQYDCSRGLAVSTDAETGEPSLTYKEGCCKLKDYNYLKNAVQGKPLGLYEVRFKNTRKGIYVNDSGQNVRVGDLVMVEASSGMDLGTVTLEGPIVDRQIKSKSLPDDPAQFKKIYRKARQNDINKFLEATRREQDTMIKARRIAAELGLEMKIGDVEFQGDGTKAIFYYIADGRVDFRQLIKVYAEEFRIKIEMKQIGSRQEAGLIGGLGICGRELCCARYLTDFKSISTSAAKSQDLFLNPQKLAGQCGKLKCCLNYEVASYVDAQSRIPRVSEPLQFEDGPAYLRKTDVLKETMYFAYDKSSDARLFPLSAQEVKEIIQMNRNGLKPASLIDDSAVEAPEFVTAVGEGSITRFDRPKRRKGNRRSQGKQGRGARESSKQEKGAPKD